MATYPSPLWPFEDYTYISTSIILTNPVPKIFLQNSFSYQPSSGIIRNTMDAGYPFVRRRFTGTVKTYAMGYSFTYPQFVTFESFFYNAPASIVLPGILQGSVAFYFPQPVWAPSAGQTEADRPVVLARWVVDESSAPYSVSPDGNTSNLLVSFNIEILPG